MGLSTATSRNSYTGNGATSVYAYSFKIFSATDLVVIKRLISTGVETTLTIYTDYTVSGVGEASGGNVTLTAGSLASTYKLIIRRVRPLTQTTDIRNQTAFYASSHEDVFDKLTMADQQQQDELNRSVKLPATFATSDFDPTLPATAVGATSVVLTTNSAGTGLDIGPSTTTIAAAITAGAAAAASATSAATSATASATSATASATSATASAASATAAAATITALGATSVPTASTVSKWDANVNFSANNFISGYTTTATSGSSTTLSVTSSSMQYFTGVTTQTVVLPVATTMVLGQQFSIINLSSGSLTVNSSGGNLVQTMLGSSSATITCVLASGTGAASWGVRYASSITGLVPVTSGGTGVGVVTTTPTASTYAGWDANSNLSANNHITGYTTTATSGSSTTLSVTSSSLQYFTGATTQTVVLPVAATMVLGQQFTIVNLSSGSLTVNSSGSNLVQTMLGSSSATITCLLASGTGAASWGVRYSSSVSGLVPITSGGTGVGSVTTVPAASSWAGWDANLNMSAVNFNAGLTNTVNSGITTTLTNASTGYQVFSTGGAGNTVVLPVASTCTVGQSFCIYNPSGTGITVNSSGANLVQTMLTGSRMIVTCLTASGTGAASWIVKYQTQLTAVPAAVTTTQWDARKCLTAQVFIPQSTSTATAAGTTTLDVNSTQHLYFTGVTTQTVVLPTASVLVNGYNFYIYNLSTGVVTVQTSGGNTVQAMASNTQLMITCINTGGGTGTASWAWTYLPITGVVPSTKGDLPTFSTVPAKIGVGANGQALVADSTAATGLKWGSVGGGSKNYLSTLTASTASGVANTGNGDLELGSTTGWGLGTVTLDATTKFPSGVPTFGSGASGNLSISAVSSSQLAGLYSLSYASSAASTAGNFVASSAFFIDLEDQAKVLTFKFAYSGVTSPTNVNWSGTSANSFGVAIYDVTNSAWIQPAGVFNITQSSGVGISTGTFQTTSNSTQYRLVVYNANATAGAATVYFDDFTVSPQTTPIGPVMTDWVAYTPTFTGFGTATGVLAYSRRVGDSLEVHMLFTAGTPTAVANKITMGYNGASGNVTLDTTKISSNTVVGYGGRSSSSTTRFATSVIGGNADLTTIALGQSTSTTAAIGAGLGNAVSDVGEAFEIFALVPIVGWSSNTSLSSDTDTRVITGRAYKSGVQSIPNAAHTKVTLDTKNFDSSGSFDVVTNNRFTAPVSGYYSVTGGVGYATASGAVIGEIWKNGAVYSYQLSTANSTGSSAIANTVLPLNAGEYVELYTFQNSGGAANLTNDPSYTYLSVFRLSGPAVVAATESINMKYTDSAGTNAISSGAGAIFKYAIKVWDTHNAYSTSTGNYTVPVSGKYSVKAQVYTASITLGTAQTIQQVIQQNGSAVSVGQTIGTGGTTGVSCLVADDVNCVAGDTISILNKCQVATTSIAAPTLNWLVISRIGN